MELKDTQGVTASFRNVKAVPFLQMYASLCARCMLAGAYTTCYLITGKKIDRAFTCVRDMAC